MMANGIIWLKSAHTFVRYDVLLLLHIQHRIYIIHEVVVRL